VVGERGGRVLAAVPAHGAAGLAAAAADAGVVATRLGLAGGAELSIVAGAARLSASLEDLSAAWERPL
jgi:hypothetical protein